MLTCQSSSNTFDIQPLFNVAFAEVFSHSVSCLCIQLRVSLAVREHCILVWSQYLIAALGSLAYEDLPRKRVAKADGQITAKCLLAVLWFQVSHMGL